MEQARGEEAALARKRRTRQHVIADLSINLTERHALLAGFAVDRVQPDYGLDLYVWTFDEDGGIESGPLLVQVKATDHLRVLRDGRHIALRVLRIDVERWLGESMPVILVVYDAPHDVAYWLDIQAYFDLEAPEQLTMRTQTLTVHLPTAHRLDAETFHHVAQLKQLLVTREQRAP